MAISEQQIQQQSTIFGHPTGLFTLFFAEMWERFSFYGMRALLIFYMIKGFLTYGDENSYAVYGAYTALVYMTPFFGGMIADRILGARRAVIFGGLLMAAGHGVMGIETKECFYGALALLIAGNGFFKPNISSMVGSLYPQGSARRDGGFTIFYIGINLGAAMSPLLCGYIGETYGWHYGFGLATIGMLIGIAVFVVPTRISQILIGLGAAAAAVALLTQHPDNTSAIAVNVFIMFALLTAAGTSCVALQRGGLPDWAGLPPDREVLARDGWKVYLGTFLVVPIFALLVSGFSTFTSSGESVSIVSAETVKSLAESKNPVVQVLSVFVAEMSKPAGLVLALAGLLAAVYLVWEAFRIDKVSRERLFVAFTLIFFSLLFWALFEQAGSSISNFTDRNVDRVLEERTITEADIGTTIAIQPTQEQLGYHDGKQIFNMTELTKLRKQFEKTPDATVDWVITKDHVGMGVTKRDDELPASTFQSVNAVFILVFGLVFSALWGALGRFEPSAPMKFAMALLQLGLGFGAIWYGTVTCDARGMVAVEWLLLGYMLHTTGELCLSPVGLSMMTKLSPTRLVSTMMGTWFLASAFAQYLAAIISQFTKVAHSDGGDGSIPPPIGTVDVYGGVFGKIAVAGIISAAAMFVLVPLLKKWMHTDKPAA